MEELTRNEYYVRGSTSLLDAIGKTIVTMDREVSDKVLFVITTDGYENSSVEFTKSQIKNLIKNHKWEFIFLGADIDSYAEASGIGIRKNNIANYRKTSDGVRNMYTSVTKASRMYRESEMLDASWKEDLE